MSKTQADTTLRRAFNHLLRSGKVTKQKDIMTLADLNESQVSNYMNNNVKISPDFTKKFEDAFGIKLADFETGHTPGNQQILNSKKKIVQQNEFDIEHSRPKSTGDSILELIRSNHNISEALLKQSRASDRIAETNAKLVKMVELSTAPDPSNTIEALTDKILELQNFLLKVATGARFPTREEAVQALGSDEGKERRTGIPAGGHN